ncbi:sensor histidine kinase [Labilibaculum sp. K2S]|uniref:sensor histidine kinase n=1 Tax=Labilibaculum sp. K2S TaxID=3056386 RepID=UPI0025A417FF|nr:sensor histidine kinase [Labilibaculum sp. K2S]MDM8161720.1 sensor histidine kinase [Labilibaculum sp. K2S]
MKRTIRFVWVAICNGILISILLLLEKHDTGKVDFLDFLILTLPIIYFSLFGFLFKTLIEWIKDRKIKAELEKDKVTSQLELLKSQINPHFLFNTLNNIDVLILDEPKRASDYLKKLSEILRFMLYETDTERVPLANEVEYINKYIELQKIRTSNDKFVELEIVGNANIGFIAPMIFIHFVENAFKYATNKKIENAISIRLDICDSKVSFMCKNHINSNDLNAQEYNGLGFQLIKQRLDLIYKGDYNLDVHEENSWYIVNLEIKLGND